MRSDRLTNFSLSSNYWMTYLVLSILGNNMPDWTLQGFIEHDFDIMVIKAQHLTPLRILTYIWI